VLIKPLAVVVVVSVGKDVSRRSGGTESSVTSVVVVSVGKDASRSSGGAGSWRSMSIDGRPFVVWITIDESGVIDEG
jgi:hypothetical protein